MNAMTLKRIGIACGSFVFSLGLGTAFSLGLIILGNITGADRQGLFGAGVGIFSFVVIWPGALTFSLILFDGIFTEGFSKHLFLKSVIWGVLLPVGYDLLIRAGANKFGLAGTFGGRGVGTLIYLMLFACPSFLLAYVGIRVNWPRKAAGSV